MGLLDTIFGDPAIAAKQRSIQRWAHEITQPSFDEIEEAPFADPHYYSDSENFEPPQPAGGEDVAKAASVQYSRLTKPAVSIERSDYKITLPVATMSQSKKYDYGDYTVAYSQWADPFNPGAADESFGFSSYAMNAIPGASTGKISLQPIHWTSWELDDVDDDDDDDNDNDDEEDDSESDGDDPSGSTADIDGPKVATIDQTSMLQEIPTSESAEAAVAAASSAKKSRAKEKKKAKEKARKELEQQKKAQEKLEAEKQKKKAKKKEKEKKANAKAKPDPSALLLTSPKKSAMKAPKADIVVADTAAVESAALPAVIHTDLIPPPPPPPPPLPSELSMEPSTQSLEAIVDVNPAELPVNQLSVAIPPPPPPSPPAIISLAETADAGKYPEVMSTSELVAESLETFSNSEQTVESDNQPDQAPEQDEPSEALAKQDLEAEQNSDKLDEGDLHDHSENDSLNQTESDTANQIEPDQVVQTDLGLVLAPPPPPLTNIERFLPPPPPPPPGLDLNSQSLDGDGSTSGSEENENANLEQDAVSSIESIVEESLRLPEINEMPMVPPPPPPDVIDVGVSIADPTTQSNADEIERAADGAGAVVEDSIEADIIDNKQAAEVQESIADDQSSVAENIEAATDPSDQPSSAITLVASAALGSVSNIIAADRPSTPPPAALPSEDLLVSPQKSVSFDPAVQDPKGGKLSKKNKKKAQLKKATKAKVETSNVKEETKRSKKHGDGADDESQVVESVTRNKKGNIVVVTRTSKDGKDNKLSKKASAKTLARKRSSKDLTTSSPTKSILKRSDHGEDASAKAEESCEPADDVSQSIEPHVNEPNPARQIRNEAKDSMLDDEDAPSELKLELEREETEDVAAEPIELSSSPGKETPALLDAGQVTIVAAIGQRTSPEVSTNAEQETSTVDAGPGMSSVVTTDAEQERSHDRTAEEEQEMPAEILAANGHDIPIDTTADGQKVSTNLNSSEDTTDVPDMEDTVPEVQEAIKDEDEPAAGAPAGATAEDSSQLEIDELSAATKLSEHDDSLVQSVLVNGTADEESSASEELDGDNAEGIDIELRESELDDDVGTNEREELHEESLNNDTALDPDNSIDLPVDELMDATIGLEDESGIVADIEAGEAFESDQIQDVTSEQTTELLSSRDDSSVTLEHEGDGNVSDVPSIPGDILSTDIEGQIDVDDLSKSSDTSAEVAASDPQMENDHVEIVLVKESDADDLNDQDDSMIPSSTDVENLAIPSAETYSSQPVPADSEPCESDAPGVTELKDQVENSLDQDQDQDQDTDTSNDIHEQEVLCSTLNDISAEATSSVAFVEIPNDDILTASPDLHELQASTDNQDEPQSEKPSDNVAFHVQPEEHPNEATQSGEQEQEVAVTESSVTEQDVVRPSSLQPIADGKGEVATLTSVLDPEATPGVHHVESPAASIKETASSHPGGSDLARDPEEVVLPSQDATIKGTDPNVSSQLAPTKTHTDIVSSSNADPAGKSESSNHTKSISTLESAKDNGQVTTTDKSSRYETVEAANPSGDSAAVKQEMKNGDSAIEKFKDESKIGQPINELPPTVIDLPSSQSHGMPVPPPPAPPPEIYEAGPQAQVNSHPAAGITSEKLADTPDIGNARRRRRRRSHRSYTDNPKQDREPTPRHRKLNEPEKARANRTSHFPQDLESNQKPKYGDKAPHSSKERAHRSRDDSKHYHGSDMGTSRRERDRNQDRRRPEVAGLKTGSAYEVNDSSAQYERDGSHAETPERPLRRRNTARDAERRPKPEMKRSSTVEDSSNKRNSFLGGLFGRSSNAAKAPIRARSPSSRTSSSPNQVKDKQQDGRRDHRQKDAHDRKSTMSISKRDRMVTEEANDLMDKESRSANSARDSNPVELPQEPTQAQSYQSRRGPIDQKRSSYVRREQQKSASSRHRRHHSQEERHKSRHDRGEDGRKHKHRASDTQMSGARVPTEHEDGEATRQQSVAEGDGQKVRKAGKRTSEKDQPRDRQAAKHDERDSAAKPSDRGGIFQTLRRKMTL